MVKIQSRKKYYIGYTIIFTMLSIFVYRYFFDAGKSFIYSQANNDGDGLIQHYTALCYYASYLRDIIKTLLFQHKFILPEWSFSIGYGSNILTTLHYYVIGDPFNLPAVLVPVRFMPYYYSFMILFRMYCGGLAFSAYSFHMIKDKKKYNETAVLAGAIIYVFCLYGMSAGIKHPYFINPMIFFPLLLLGVEKIMKKQSPALFMITVAVSACSNFYFFYMLVILTVVYVFARLFFRYGFRELKRIGKDVLHIFLYSLVGLGTGMVLFLPVMLTVFQDSRFGNGTPLQIFYEMKYYTTFPGSFLSTTSGGNWCLLGFAAISLPSVILMFCNRKTHKLLSLGFIISTVMLLIPAVNYALNGFAYAASRWVWAYAFLVSYIVVRMWPELYKMASKHFKIVFFAMLGFFIVCMFLDDSRTADTAFPLVCAFASLCLLQTNLNIYWKESIALMLIAVNIVSNGAFIFSLQGRGEIEEFADYREANTLVFDSFDDAVAEASAKDKSSFFRYSQSHSNNNASLLSGLHSLQYYWSLSNHSIIRSNDELGILLYTQYMYYDLNSRTRLTSLANVKYYVAPKGWYERGPYGFSYIDTYRAGGNEYDVYENQDALPFGYTYDSVLDAAEFERSTSIEKEEAMFQSAYIEEEDTKIPLGSPILTGKRVPYTISCKNDDITYKDHCFVVTKKDASAVLEFDGIKESETALLFQGLKYKGCPLLELYKDESPFDPLNKYSKSDWEKLSPVKKKKIKDKSRDWEQESHLNISVNGIDEEQHAIGEKFWLLNSNYTWYSGKEDFTVNLRYSDKKRTAIEIVFPCEGIYSFDEIAIECLPIKNYHDNLEKLKKDSMENVKFDVDRITGTITLEKPKLLCLSIPYEKGWEAYVDGKKEKIIKTNYMYSGIALDAGRHEIELVYHTPGFRTGLIVSFVCGILLLAISLRFCAKDKRNAHL